MAGPRPNILMLMCDQLGALALPAYGNATARAPRIEGLARGGTVFENAYCNSPLCAPSRFSMLSGRHCSRIGAHDNAAEFPASVPTVAHHLRSLDYRCILAGKMHFAGPDQLHGFEERLTTDVYPADFEWTPDWLSAERPFWYHDPLSVTEAGIYERTQQLDFDEEVSHRAHRKLLDLARDADPRPFFMVASFTQPHDPYMAPRSCWDRFDHRSIDMPRVGPIPEGELDPHSRRLRAVCGLDLRQPTPEQVRNARHAYHAMIAWVDDQIGRLLDTLAATGMDRDTLVVLTADHGDMLGERGLWYKMCFFEPAARVPLLFAGAGAAAGRRVAAPVSLLDLLPTLVTVAGGAEALARVPDPEGRSLAAAIAGDGGPEAGPVVAEYLGEGAVAPMLMVRDGSLKYVSCPADPPMLFDLSVDPLELHDLAGRPEHAAAEARLAAVAGAHWDAGAVHAAVLDSQRRRRSVADALARGTRHPWDWQPTDDASRQYTRNLAGEMYDTDRRARIPGRATAGEEDPG